MRQTPITVVVIQSLSYTGTTWINLLLGCHEKALAIGPLHRILRLSNPGDACRVHGSNCSFWPEFLAEFDHSKNVFTQLADFTGKHVFIVNNPLPEDESKHLNHPDLWIKRVRVVRDARGVFASWLRVHPDSAKYRGENPQHPGQAVLDFLPMITAEFGRIDPKNEGILFCRYEDVLAEKEYWLEKFSRFIGLDYKSEAFRYWTHDIHPTAGNQGTISLIKFAQGILVPDSYRDKAFYEEQYARAERNQPFDAASWKQHISQETQYLISIGAYDYQSTLGYDMDYPEQLLESVRNNIRSKHKHFSEFQRLLDHCEAGVPRNPGQELLQKRSRQSKLYTSLYKALLPVYKRAPGRFKVWLRRQLRN